MTNATKKALGNRCAIAIHHSHSSYIINHFFDGTNYILRYCYFKDTISHQNASISTDADGCRELAICIDSYDLF